MLYAPASQLSGHVGDVLVGGETTARLWVVSPRGSGFRATRVPSNLRGKGPMEPRRRRLGWLAVVWIRPSQGALERGRRGGMLSARSCRGPRRARQRPKTCSTRRAVPRSGSAALRPLVAFLGVDVGAMFTAHASSSGLRARTPGYV